MTPPTLSREALAELQAALDYHKLIANGAVAGGNATAALNAAANLKALLFQHAPTLIAAAEREVARREKWCQKQKLCLLHSAHEGPCKDASGDVITPAPAPDVLRDEERCSYVFTSGDRCPGTRAEHPCYYHDFTPDPAPDVDVPQTCNPPLHRYANGSDRCVCGEWLDAPDVTRDVTLRDEIAMRALQGILAQDMAGEYAAWPCDPDEDTARRVAQGAYKYADAMLRERGCDGA